MIGINNRDLDDFTVDIERTFELLADVPAGKTVVSESGIRTREQLDELERVGVDAVLVGETLMRAATPRRRCRELAGTAEPRDETSDTRSSARQACQLQRRLPTLGLHRRAASADAARIRSSRRCSAAPSWPSPSICCRRRRRRTTRPRPSSSRRRSPPPSASSQSAAGLTAHDIYKRDAPGVVFVRAADRPAAATSPFDLFPQRSSAATATGSGFVIDDDGDILTNAHVVEGAIEGHRRSSATSRRRRDGRRQGPVHRPRAAEGRPRRARPAPARARRLSEACRSATRWSRSATRSASTARSRPASSSALQRQIKAPNGFTIEQRDPDRRRDQPRQLGRPAARRRRARDRHQLADRDRRRRQRQRRHRLRGADRHGQGRSCRAQEGRDGRARLPRR